MKDKIEKAIGSARDDLERKIDDLDLPDLSVLEEKSKLVETPALAPPAKSKKKGGVEEEKSCWQTAAGGSWQNAGMSVASSGSL
jgi:hypothetical protein